MRDTLISSIGKIIITIIGLFTGYELYKNAVMYWVFKFWIEPNEICYWTITYSVLVLTCLLCVMVLYKMVYKEIPKVIKNIITIIYVPLIILCWIGPNQMDYTYTPNEWNPFYSIYKLCLFREFGFMGIEILSFVPIGMMTGRKIKQKTALAGFIFSAILIEVLQSLISTAPFRTLDCILYLAGMMIGYNAVQWKLNKEAAICVRH